jgi:hypothetical protein
MWILVAPSSHSAAYCSCVFARLRGGTPTCSHIHTHSVIAGQLRRDPDAQGQSRVASQPFWLIMAVICVAAIATVGRFKDYGHVAPSVALSALSALNLALLVG